MSSTASVDPRPQKAQKQRGYMGRMEKKMEAIGIIGVYCILFGINS